MWPDEMDLSGLPARRNRCDQDGGEQRWDTSLHTDLHAREHEHEACLSKALSNAMTYVCGESILVLRRKSAPPIQSCIACSAIGRAAWRATAAASDPRCSAPASGLRLCVPGGERLV